MELILGKHPEGQTFCLVMRKCIWYKFIQIVKVKNICKN